MYRTVVASLCAAAMCVAVGTPRAEGAPWDHRDIGDVAVAGSATFARNGRVKVQGEGADIGSTADAFHFVYQELPGDGTLVARVASLQNTNPWAKAGVMLRQDLAGDSIHTSLLVTPSNGLVFEQRTTTGGGTATQQAAGMVPVWLRISRAGGTVTAASSSDGATWTIVGTRQVAFAGAVYVGLAVTSHRPSRLASATFERVSITADGAPEPPPPAAGPVAAWSFDEGAGPSVRDATGVNTGTISGATWTPAGRYGAALFFNGADSLVSVPDHASLDLSTGMTIEAWVKPDVVTGWRNVLLKEAEGGLAYGLYANADTNVPAGYLNTGGADVAASGPSALPAGAWSFLAITYDGVAERIFLNGSQVGGASAAGAIVQTAGALRIGGNRVWSENFQGTIDNVRIYDRPLSLAEIQADMVTPVPSVPDVTAPSVAIVSPSPDAIVAGVVSIAAVATDDVGLANVRILVNGTVVGSAAAGSPFTVVWDTTSVANGTCSLTAVATDGAGNSAVSATVPVSVNNAAAPARPRLVEFTSPDHNALLPDGRAAISGYRLEIWRAGDDISKTQPYATTDMGKPATTSTSVSVDEQAFLATLPSGQEFFTTVLAMGPNGNSRSTSSNAFLVP